MNLTGESPNLDLLRTLAVTCVVVFHLLLFFWKTNLGLLWFIGHWGVLLFFVHTSLVLMLSLERQQQTMPEANLFWPFYLRRLFRLYPLSILTVVAIAIFRWPVAHLAMGQFTSVHLGVPGLIANLFLVQNDTRYDSIVAPLWSLPYEMQMYLVFPALFLLVRASRTVLPVLAIWMGAFAAAYASHHVLHGDHPNLLMFAPCFLAGIVAYKVSKRTKLQLPFWGWPVTLAVVTFAYLSSPRQVRGWVCCLVVGLAIPLFAEMQHLWLRKACHVIARYSYGVYLAHFVCIWFAFADLPKLPLPERWLIFIVVGAVVPVILYHFVEAPMISVGHRLVRRLVPNHSH